MNEQPIGITELRAAAAKYRCLARSEGPTELTFRAGAELDKILEALALADKVRAYELCSPG